MKDPISLVQYQMLLAKLQPRTIFDLGTCGGGSAIWLADQCRAMGLDTIVVTMDIEDLRPQHVKDYMARDEKILFLEGDAQIKKLVVSPAINQVVHSLAVRLMRVGIFL